MNITIIGTGYVGLVTGACLADLGHSVFCLDLDQAKVDLLNAGEIPIFEPGLHDIVERNREAERLQFSTDIAASVAHAEIQFIAVGTPSDEDGSADLRHVMAAARNIAQHMDGFRVIVNKSTVPVGSADQVSAVVQEVLQQRGRSDLPYAVISNPEFLKEGAAVEDFTRPDRIVLGIPDTAVGQRALALMRELYAPFNRNHERTRVMDVRSSEFTKYAANAMLAARISFMNELANLAEQVGADIELVRQGIGSDPRIGYSFLYAGAGYGGSCFPKDVQALTITARGLGRQLHILDAVQAVNQKQKQVLLQKIVARFGPDLRGKRFAAWGLSFKPNTNDMREAPSRTVISGLLRAGAHVVAHDPVARKEAQEAFEKDFADQPQLLQQIEFVTNAMQATQDADALIIFTEWRAYSNPNWIRLKQNLKTPLIFDGRNLYEPSMMTREGFDYEGIGRRASAQPVPSDSV